MNPLDPAPRLAPRQFSAVVFSTAGVFAGFALHLWVAPTAPTDGMMSSTRLLSVIGIQAVMAAFWVPRLRRCGWRHSTMSLPATPSDLPKGVVLFVVATLNYWTLWMVTWVAWPSVIKAAIAVHIGGRPAWWAVALASLANPVAEEFLYLGFIARALEAKSPALALCVCAAARLAVHVYQGPWALLYVLPVGVLFGAYYLASHRIWPVVVAHCIMDAVALGRMAGAA